MRYWPRGSSREFGGPMRELVSGVVLGAVTKRGGRRTNSSNWLCRASRWKASASKKSLRRHLNTARKDSACLASLVMVGEVELLALCGSAARSGNPGLQQPCLDSASCITRIGHSFVLPTTHPHNRRWGLRFVADAGEETYILTFLQVPYIKYGWLTFQCRTATNRSECKQISRQCFR